MSNDLNLLTDVGGLGVGHAEDPRLRSGVTVVVFDRPAVASVATLGGAPADRSSAGLEPDTLVPEIDAVVLSGGSSFGLDAATGVEAWLREQGRGFLIGPARVPVVVQAICFDLLNGGDKDWGRFPPYRDLGYAACCDLSAGAFTLGTAGGGYGATTVNLKGGVGSASTVTPSGFRVGALMVVNAIGSAVIGDGPYFWAAPFERAGEFGGLGWPSPPPADALKLAWKGGPELGTTIGVVVTDATLTKAMAKRLAIAASDGVARSLRLAHALTDGDTLFAAATGRRELVRPLDDQIEIGAVAADCVARAVARGVHAATGFAGGASNWVAWRERFGETRGGQQG
jgi:L-aminopeptidase/D-esterase-like protein